MNENLKELAYETSKQKIIQYEYRPNTFLRESLLMKEIDASRTPIREALNKLEQEGFITILPKKESWTRACGYGCLQAFTSGNAIKRRLPNI